MVLLDDAKRLIAHNFEDWFSFYLWCSWEIWEMKNAIYTIIYVVNCTHLNDVL